MTLPDPVRSGVQSVLGTLLGRAVRIESVSPVGGGCISPTGRVTTDAGRIFFLKWGSPELPDALLAAEARGLRSLAEAGAVRVPDVIAAGGDAPAWLLLEWLEPGVPNPDAWRCLGADLAALHQSLTPQFGAEADNFIGSLPQTNQWTDDWAGFWRAHRLEPQLRSALDSGLLGDGDRHRFQTLFQRLPELLAPALDDGASLLHGDLWSGNVHITGGGAAVIDPSSYHGHREVDLAMADLFGGFGGDFEAAYREAWPLAPGYAPTRRAIYQLYYLLVHVNLFGASYVGRTRRALASAGV